MWDSPAWIPLLSIRARLLWLRAQLGPQALLLAQVQSWEGMVPYKNREQQFLKCQPKQQTGSEQKAVTAFPSLCLGSVAVHVSPG